MRVDEALSNSCLAFCLPSRMMANDHDSPDWYSCTVADLIGHSAQELLISKMLAEHSHCCS